MPSSLLTSSILALHYIDARHLPTIQKFSQAYTPYIGLDQQCTLHFSKAFIELQDLFHQWRVFRDNLILAQVYARLYNIAQSLVFYMPPLFPILKDQFLFPLVLLVHWHPYLLLYLELLFRAQSTSQLPTSQLYTSQSLVVYIVQDPSLDSFIYILDLLYYLRIFQPYLEIYYLSIKLQVQQWHI